MNIIVLGPQGSGKGTQAELIAKEFKFPHISTGDLFRENMKSNTLLGAQAKQFTDTGRLVPDDITNKMIRDRLRQIDCSQGFILDGYPRTVEQLQVLLDSTKIDAAVDIEISDEEALERISGRRLCSKCGKGYHVMYLKPRKPDTCDICQSQLVRRTDDESDAVIERLRIYHEQTEPLLEILNQQGILRVVNGSQSIEEVFRDVKLMLNKKF